MIQAFCRPYEYGTEGFFVCRDASVSAYEKKCYEVSQDMISMMRDSAFQVYNKKMI